MRGLKALVPIAILGTAGCAERHQQAVFVDLDRAVRLETVAPLEPVLAIPTHPPALSASTMALPELPQRTVQFTGTEAQIKRVERLVEEGRDQAYRDLASSLRRSYMNDIRRIENERLGALDPEERRRYSEVIDSLRQYFEAYADERARPLLDLSLIAGFPDPDPTSERPPVNAAPWFLRRFARAKEAREEIRRLDAAYEARMEGFFASVRETKAAEVTQIRIEIEEMRAKADAQANEEAARQIAREHEQIQSVFGKPTSVRLPGAPGRTITIQGAPPVVAAPVVKTPGADEIRQRLREALATDVVIWAGVSDYELVKRAKEGRDATEEFIRWRKSRLAGR